MTSPGDRLSSRWHHDLPTCPKEGAFHPIITNGGWWQVFAFGSSSRFRVTFHGADKHFGMLSMATSAL
ncbi:hypothetical protein LSAT2_013190 [Lamellibrachia satsuma]|nr:hypothetical protein LSAT2_013190 [Lamellibrachia satsuma]